MPLVNGIIIHNTENIWLYVLGNPNSNFKEVCVLAKMLSDTVICSGPIKKGGEYVNAVKRIQ